MTTVVHIEVRTGGTWQPYYSWAALDSGIRRSEWYSRAPNRLTLRIRTAVLTAHLERGFSDDSALVTTAGEPPDADPSLQGLPSAVERYHYDFRALALEFARDRWDSRMRRRLLQIRDMLPGGDPDNVRITVLESLNLRAIRGLLGL